MFEQAGLDFRRVAVEATDAEYVLEAVGDAQIDALGPGLGLGGLPAHEGLALLINLRAIFLDADLCGIADPSCEP
ncbi:hypothetical protein D3C81_2177180 [compost metagenome]